jgi:antitoxin HicB
MRYPITLERLDDRTVMATCPTVPEIMTAGKDESDALDMALDAALTVFCAMMDDNEIPLPSDIDPDAPFIELPPMAVVKLAIYQGMRDQGVSQLKMARACLPTRNPCGGFWICTIAPSGTLEMALEALGYRAVVRWSRRRSTGILWGEGEGAGGG